MLKEGIGFYKGRRKDTGGYVEGYLAIDAQKRYYICEAPFVSIKYNNDVEIGPFSEVDASTVTPLMGGGRVMTFLEKIKSVIRRI